MADEKLTRLVIDVRPGDRLAVSDSVTVELLHKSGQHARLLVMAPANIRIVKDSAHRPDEAVPSMAT